MPVTGATATAAGMAAGAGGNSSTSSPITSSSASAVPVARPTPPLARHLGLAMVLTVVLIVLNANYSPRSPSSIEVATGPFGAHLGRTLSDGMENMTISEMQQAAVAGGEEDEEEEDEGEEEEEEEEEEEAKEATQSPPPPTCQDGSKGPSFTSLKVVDDITQESDVELIADIHRPPQFTEVPQPIMTDRYNQKELCQSYKWKYCVDVGGEDADRHKLFYTCEIRDFVAKVNCAYIDGRQRIFGGLVYDHERRFPVHAAHPSDTSLGANSRYDNLVKYDKLSHNLAVYPFATAHTFERLPRLFLLIKTLPEDVPILVADSGLSRSFFDVLDKYGVFPKSRLVWWDPDKIYYANTVYFAGEMGLVPKGSPGDRNNSHWDSLRVEHCSWAISQPRWLFQESMQKVFWEEDRKETIRVLVVHRRDAGTRMIDNHDEMMGVLKQRLPSEGVEISTFVGSEHNVEDTLRLFANADVLIAPHGAAITFTAVMRPGRAVIEVGYSGRSGMMWPGNYFHTMVVGSDLVYYATLADGNYGSSLHVNVEDVAKLANMAIEHVKSLPENSGSYQNSGGQEAAEEEPSP